MNNEMNECVFKPLLKYSNEQMHKCLFEHINKHFNEQTFNHSIGRLSQSLFCLSECLMVRYG